MAHDISSKKMMVSWHFECVCMFPKDWELLVHNSKSQQAKCVKGHVSKGTAAIKPNYKLMLDWLLSLLWNVKQVMLC